MTKWVRVEGGVTFCQRCGARVTIAWQLFTGTTSTLCYCERCVEELLHDPA